MAKQRPPNTTAHQLYIPDDLDRKIKVLAKYGTVDDFIIKCIQDGMNPLWEAYVEQEYARLKPKYDDENKQGTIRRASPQDAPKAAAENHRNKKPREKQSR